MPNLIPPGALRRTPSPQTERPPCTPCARARAIASALLNKLRKAAK